MFHIPVSEMMQRLSNEELQYWLILQAIDPIGETRADLRAAIYEADQQLNSTVFRASEVDDG